jgi:hypothetical protein
LAKVSDPAKVKPGDFAELRRRAAQEAEEGGLLHSLRRGVGSLLSRLRGTPAPARPDHTEQGDQMLVQSMTGGMQQWQLDRLVAAAKGDRNSEARQAINLLADHYGMTPERFLQTWSEWRRNPNFVPIAPLHDFAVSQRALMGQGNRTPYAYRDPDRQGEQFLDIAEKRIRKDLKNTNSPVKQEANLVELVRLRPDAWNEPLAQKRVPVARLIQAANAPAAAQPTTPGGPPPARGNFTPGQLILLEHMRQQVGLRSPGELVALLQHYKPGSREKMNWGHIQEIVAQASPADPRAQVKLVKAGRLTPEAMGLIWGPRATDTAIAQYLYEERPGWDLGDFLTKYRSSAQTFDDFYKTYELTHPYRHGRRPARRNGGN